MNHQPPRLAKSLLRRFCHVSFIEEVEGDLDEQFYENLERTGLFRARIQYWLDVSRAIVSGNGSSRETPSSTISFFDALNHFFKIFFRSLRRSRSSAIINVTGLVLSLMSFVVIWLYVNDELMYDRFHPDADNIYRISLSYNRMGDGAVETDARAAGMWIVKMAEVTPGIKDYTRFSKFGMPGFVKYPAKDMLFEEAQVFWVDSTYTGIFSLQMISGEAPASILKDPAKAIISEATAHKYFGDEDPVGKEIIYSRAGMDFPLTVAGVMKDYPSNAHFHPSFMVSNIALNPLWKRDGSDRVNSWGDTFTYSFFKVEDESVLPKATAELDAIIKKNINDTSRPALTKLTDIHFTGGRLIELEASGDKLYAYVSASIGVLILIIAAINYMNLATARSVRRSKEVGLRKTLGVKKTSLVSQFLGESLMMMFISFVMSLGLTGLLLPFFNQLTGKTFTFLSLFEGTTMVILLSVIVVIAILSGMYPAFYLSRFRPADVLKGRVTTGSGAEDFRKVLVVFQFTVTMMLIACAAIIHNQLSFMQAGKLASNTEQVMTIRTVPSRTSTKVDLFRNQLMQNKDVVGVSFSDHLPRRDGFSFITLPFIIRSKGKEEFMWDMLKADENFATMFNLDFVAGRNFSYTTPADTNNCILNESAVKALGLTPEEAVGQEITVRMGFEENVDDHPYGKVIGVVKDFQYSSMRYTISPMTLYGHYASAETMNIRLAGGDISNMVQGIEKVWKNVYPSRPFHYWFMDSEFEKMYRQELRMASLSNYFTVFTIVIACLGLFGLAAFTAEQKTKEIGIRKVLGASVGQILLLLTNKFVRLVLVACVVAIPVSFYLMNVWLEGFAYRAPMQWWVFAGAGGIILVLTYLTVGIESFRAAIANPVDSIKHE